MSKSVIDGCQPVLPSACYGSKWGSKSRPSAKDGVQNFVFVQMRGGWNGNLSRKRISKLYLSTGEFDPIVCLSISS